MSVLKPKRRLYRVVIYVVAIVLVLLAIDLVLVQIRLTIHPGLDTTRITSPNAPDGSVDYLTAIETEFSRGVTDENNAAPLILEAFGRNALPKNQPPDGITNRLHMAHLPESGNYLTSLSGPEPDVEAWPFPAEERITQWLAANEKPLAKLREAAQRSHYFVPMNGGTPPEFLYEILLPHLNAMRTAARGLAIHALQSVRDGDFKSARSDLLAIHRLARLTAQGPTLVERMVSIATEDVACRTDRNIAQHAKLDAETAEAFLHDAFSLAELPPLTRNVDAGERYLVLDLEQLCSRRGPYGTGRLYMSISSAGQGGVNMQAAQLLRFLPIPHAQAMRAENEAYDALIVALAKPHYVDRKPAIAAVERWYDEHSNGVINVVSPRWLLRLVLPGLASGQDKLETVTAQFRMTQITWALAAYRAEHGSYPDSLDLLKSQFPTGIPEDNFSEQPFHYHRKGEGCQLYSVGPNMTDDKGATTKPADDIDCGFNQL